MNIKFKNSIWFYIFILGIFLASNAYAWSGKERCFDPGEKEVIKGKMEARFKEISKELNLTPEQEEQLKAHKTQNREGMKAFRHEISNKRKELREELQKQELDMEKINQLNNELKIIHSEMQDNRLEGILEVRNILSPEQYTKFRAFIGKHRNGMKRHRKGFGRMKKGGE
ncbi:Spy/CpxP family protein refolding chaperone [Candidatus Omnitrophota bacterium]